MRVCFRAVFVVTLFTLTSAACGTDSEPEDVRVHRQEIKGGQLDRENTAVVGMYAANGGICSGTLIAPNMVLTAQHCVARINSQYVACGRTTFGDTFSPSSVYVTTQPYLTRDRSSYHLVEEIQVPPGGTDMCGYDIAVLILREDVPTSEATPIIPRVDIEAGRGESYTAVGYGHTGDGSGAGVRRYLDGRYVQCEGDSCPHYTSVQGTEFLGTDGTCQGDSGGAALDAEGRVLGALSRGPDGCRAAIYTSVWGWSDWLREMGERAAEKGGYEPHFWVTHGISELPEDDMDLDGVTADVDNCGEIANEDQADIDDDGLGDACDDNSDGDDVTDDEDNCPLTDNPDQEDADGDGFGDACDDDDDDDGIEDEADYCPFDQNYQDYGDPCGLDPNTMVVVVDDEQPGGCATNGFGNAQLPALLVFGMFAAARMRRRRAA